VKLGALAPCVNVELPLVVSETIGITQVSHSDTVIIS